MHIRIDQKRFEQILQNMQAALDRQREHADEGSWPTASGIGRGGLISAQQMLLTSQKWDTHSDYWDELESELDAQIAEERLTPPIPDWPSIRYAQEERIPQAQVS